jgi:hypothetical protein
VLLLLLLLLLLVRKNLPLGCCHYLLPVPALSLKSLVSPAARCCHLHKKQQYNVFEGTRPCIASFN